MEKVRTLLALLGCSALVIASCRCRDSTEEAGPTERDARATPPATVCADGRSEDPPPEELEPSREVIARGSHTTPAGYYGALATRYPQSATVRVRGGAGAMHARPPDPTTAERFYREALRLHEDGCRLADGEHWLALEGLGLVSLMQDDNRGAIEWFRRGVARWPDIPQTQYNLACAYCRAGDVDACYEAFLRALDAAAAGGAPAFVTNPGSLELFVRLSRDDPDLARLRTDPRYEATVARRLEPAPSADSDVNTD